MRQWTCVLLYSNYLVLWHASKIDSAKSFDFVVGKKIIGNKIWQHLKKAEEVLLTIIAGMCFWKYTKPIVSSLHVLPSLSYFFHVFVSWVGSHISMPYFFSWFWLCYHKGPRPIPRPIGWINPGTCYLAKKRSLQFYDRGSVLILLVVVLKEKGKGIFLMFSVRRNKACWRFPRILVHLENCLTYCRFNLS